MFFYFSSHLKSVCFFFQTLLNLEIIKCYVASHVCLSVLTVLIYHTWCVKYHAWNPCHVLQRQIQLAEVVLI